MTLNLDYVDLRISCSDLVFNSAHNDWLLQVVRDALFKTDEEYNYNVEIVESTSP